MTLDAKTIEHLIEAARAVSRHAYCPYSKFPVGAALLSETGDIFSGCNVENASYPNGSCAERTALGVAVSQGHRKFTAIAITSEMDKSIVPCGSCRQILAEFSLDMVVIMTSGSGGYETTTVRDLLPMSFTQADVFSVNNK